MKTLLFTLIVLVGIVAAQIPVTPLSYGIQNTTAPGNNTQFLNFYSINLRTTGGVSENTFITLSGVYIPPDTIFQASFNFTELSLNISQFTSYARGYNDYEIWVLSMAVSNPVLYISLTFFETQDVLLYIDVELANNLNNFKAGPLSVTYMSANLAAFQKYWIEIPTDSLSTYRYFYSEVCSPFTPLEDAVTDYYFTIYWDPEGALDDTELDCQEDWDVVDVECCDDNYRRNLCPARAYINVNNYTFEGSHFAHVFFAPLAPLQDIKNVVVWTWDGSNELVDIVLPQDMSMRGARVGSDLLLVYNAVTYPGNVVYKIYSANQDSIGVDFPTSACYAAKNYTEYTNSIEAGQALAGSVALPSYFSNEPDATTVYLVAVFTNSSYNNSAPVAVTYSAFTVTGLLTTYSPEPFWVTSSTVVAAVLGGISIILLVVVIYFFTRSTPGYENIK